MKKIAVAVGAVLLSASVAFANTAPVQESVTHYVPVVVSAPQAGETATTVPFDWTKPGPFAVIQLGAYGPTDDDKDYDRYDPQAGFLGGLALGYRFSPFLSAQGEVGYQQSDGEYSNWDYSAIPAFAVAHVGMPIEKDGELYALAGIGAVFYSVNDVDDSKDDVSIATKLGLGCAYHFGKYKLGGEVAYQMTDVSDAPNDAIIAVVTLGFGH